ncbi:MAG: NAD(P)-dependent alcohol dehydrogenase [Actinomycetota bacterium]|nr:NAD(P)-dependent alcohol dehydrogenase [Actinomycetota bacterium]
MNRKMRAIVARGHGGPKVLRTEEVERPEARGKKVLMEVYAAGVNPIDWRIRRGELRPLSFLMPQRIPGRDVAGAVVEVGDEVRGFEVGDRVFAMLDGASGGGYAEYAVAGEDAIARMPENLTFEEAAAVPLAALTAVQAIRDALREVTRNAPHACDTGELARRRVLINGASGGVGTFAVQFAKISGAVVTAVCSAESAALAGELGADHVVDYKEEDFARHEERYDVIFDVVGNRSFGVCKRALRPAGVYVTTEPGPRNFLSQVATIPAQRKARVVLVKPSGEHLSLLKQLFEAGRLRVVLDSVYPLEEVAEAHAHGEMGHARGKIVLRVDR